MANKEAQEAVSEFEGWLKVWSLAQEKANQDDAFRAALIQNPRAALKQYFQYDLDPKIELNVVDGGADEGAKLTLHLPSKKSGSMNLKIAC